MIWIGVAATLVLLGAGEMFVRKLAPRWEERQYTVQTPRVATRNLVIRLSIASFAGLAGWFYLPEPQTVAGFATAGWLAALSWQTDIADRKIPSEPCYAAFLVGTIIGVTAFTTAGFASAVTAFFIITFLMLFVAFITRGALGSGDVRLMAALTPLAWFVGYTPFLIGLMVGCVIQMVLWVTVYRTSRNVGKPFGPALIAGVVFSIVFFSTPTTVCAEWAGLLSCGS